MECSANVLNGDFKACGPAITVPPTTASRPATFTVTTGPVGTGSCHPGDRCYIALVDAANPYSLTVAEIDFAKP